MLSALRDEHYSGVFDDFLPATQAWTPSGYHGLASGCDRATLYLGHCLYVKEVGWQVELWVIIFLMEMNKGAWVLGQGFALEGQDAPALAPAGEHGC